MKIIIIRTILAFFIVAFGFAQSDYQQQEISLSAQKFTYKDPGSDRLLTEIDISFTKSQLIKMGDFASDTLDVIVEISKNEQLAVRGWHLVPLKEYLSDSLRSVFLDQFTFALDEGSYAVRILVKNRKVKPPVRGELKDKIDIPKYNREALFASDILISDLITKPQNSSDRFIKNGIFVQPFPFKIFSPAKPLMFFYMEIYNMQGLTAADLSFKITVLDGSNKVVKKLIPPKIYARGQSAFSMCGQNMMALKNGLYTLNAELWRGEQKILTRQSSFRIIKKKRIKKKIRDLGIDPEYLTKTEMEIDDEIYVLKYIMKEKTWKNFKDMNLENKRKNLTAFWKRNDLTKGTPENEFKIHYFKLVAYVRAEYSDGQNDGIDTDMGRILLMYDKPAYINRNVDDEISGQSVELWKYQKFQAIFLFVQENYTGPYRLVHSTMKGEIYDPLWVSYLKANSDLIDY